MATNVIMPALGMAQETGKLLSWLKNEGQMVIKGEPIMEVETDKATVEVEAPASGILSKITAQPGADIPVGQVIATILAGEEGAELATKPEPELVQNASPVARKMAEELGIDLARIKPVGEKIGKEDVQAYLAKQEQDNAARPLEPSKKNGQPRLSPASPKARRLAHERGLRLDGMQGSGPDNAVLAIDLPESDETTTTQQIKPQSSNWQVMSERLVLSWTSAPHFYLMRDINAAGLVEMRRQLVGPVESRTGGKPTYTDLLVKLVAHSLHDHPEMNARWENGSILLETEINIGIAVGIDDGLTVPVIRHADKLSVSEIALQRQDLVARAANHKLHPQDLSGGSFTITNLGMYNVDAFLAVINPPQAAILSVGRIADRVVPVSGQPGIQPMFTISLACDHRTIDGMRAAKFLDDLANLMMNPWGLFA